jgi:hypothetical protein
MAIGWGVYDNFSTSNGVESPSPSFHLTNFYTSLGVLGFRNYDDTTAEVRLLRSILLVVFL